MVNPTEQPKTRSYFNSLRGKITNRSILIGVIPIILLGLSSWFGLQSLTESTSEHLQSGENRLLETVIGSSMQAAAKRTIELLDNFILERIRDAKQWASTEVVISAARSAAEEHIALGYHELPINEVESQFPRQIKSHNSFPQATSYINRQIEQSEHFGEIFFTDEFGFNVALTNPTSDFVQRDENWWKSAWENGISVGSVEYDQSAGIWSVDISVRIDDPVTGKSLGVLKAVLSVSLIQEVADKQVGSIEGGSVQIVSSTGLLLADTLKRHSSNVIMNENVNIRQLSDPEYNVIFGSTNGFVLADNDVVGFARSGGADFYAAVANRFQGFDWTVIVRQPNTVALRSVEDIRKIKTDINNIKKRNLQLMIGVVVLVLCLSVALSWGTASIIVHPITRLREAADEVSMGKTDRDIRFNSNDEIEDLAESFNRMRLAVSIMIERARRASKNAG